MTPEVIGFIIAFALFLFFIIGGLSVPVAILVPSVIYLYALGGWTGFKALGIISWANLNSFTLTAIPLFILMAEILERSGLIGSTYSSLSRFLSIIPGGLLQSNIFGCAVFSSVTGSSVATAAAVGTSALPQLLERGYDKRLAAGSLAAGGTLGILLPPSIAMILYATFTEVSVSQLFIAGIVPGIILTALFMSYIAVNALIRPEIAPREAGPDSWGDALKHAWRLLPIGILIVATLGSIYSGWATPTEAAAVGSVIALLISIIFGRFGVSDLLIAFRRTTFVVGNILFLVFSAYVFSHAISFGGVGEKFTEFLIGLNLSRIEFILVLFLLYSLLGAMVESMGIIVITVPLLFPVLGHYDIDPIWFGIMLVVFIEMGMITPPIGINLFVIQSLWKGTLKDVVMGSIPFHLLMFVLLGMLVIWPELALWLTR